MEALIKLLPRITYPALTEADVTGLELPDLLEFAGKVIGFLSPVGTLTLPPSLTVDDLMAISPWCSTGRHPHFSP